MAQSQTTIDHKTIRKWVEDRGGHPASVAATHSEDDAGLLRIDFGKPEKELDELSWDEFFEKFEEAELAFLYQDENKDGKTSRFFKFVKRTD